MTHTLLDRNMDPQSPVPPPDCFCSCFCSVIPIEKHVYK